MVGTIGPMVHGLRIRQHCSWAYWFIAAHVVGASVTGFLVSLIGTFLRPFVASLFWLAVAIAFVGAARELGMVRFSLPSSRWQVPRRWSLLHPSVMATRYGFLLGFRGYDCGSCMPPST